METIKVLSGWILWIVPVAREHFSGEKLPPEHAYRIVSAFGFGIAPILVFISLVFSNEITSPWKIAGGFLCFVIYLFIGFVFEEKEHKNE